MTPAVPLIRHRKTLADWSGDGKTWIWYEGSRSTLEGLKREAMERFANGVEVGLAEYVSGSPERGILYMAFVFNNPEDAMIFKLSVA